MSTEGALRFERFEHGADVGVRGVGPTLEQAFDQAARALTSVIADPAMIAPRVAVKIECEAFDQEALLVEWLNALVFEMATRRMLFSRFDVHLAGLKLEATAWGEPIDRERHQPVVEVKGATYTELKVRSTAEGWVAQCIVDV